MTGDWLLQHNPRRHGINKSLSGAVALIIGGICCAVIAGEVFAQAGTGPGSAVPGLGSTMDPHKGPESGTKRDAHFGTIVSDSGHSQSSPGIAEVLPGSTRFHGHLG